MESIHQRTPTSRHDRSLAKRLAVVLVLCFSQAGCMAMRLASRGAPDRAMREFEIPFEPVDLAATADEEYNDQPTLTPVWTEIPAAGWLHGYDFHVIDAHGDTLPRELLHHLKVMRPGYRELFNPIMLHLAGSGGETRPVSIPREVGYPLEEGDTLLVTAMLHNRTGRDLEGVRLIVELRYSPEPGPWKPPLAVVPFFAHVTPPMSDPSYDLPAGRSEQSIELRPAVSGRIMGLGGHLHRYGVLLRLVDQTEGELIWEKEAERSSDGEILEVPYDRFVWSSLPELRSDHVYLLTAIHDNPTGALIPGGGMGTLGGAIMVDGPWPEVDRSAPEYAWYLNREANSAQEMGHQHH